MNQLAPAALSAWLADPARPRPVLLDVREAWEFERCSIPGSLHVPMREVPARAAEIEADREVVVICHHGGRSMQVGLFLERQGYNKVYNLSGGVDAWARTVDPSMPVY